MTDEDRLAEALEEAERAAREAVERRLGTRLGDYRVVVKAERLDDGSLRVVVDVDVSASRSVPREVVEAVVEDAVERARRAFEEVALRSGRRARGARG